MAGLLEVRRAVQRKGTHIVVTFTEAEATAYRASARDSPAQMARWRQDNLGQRVSAVGSTPPTRASCAVTPAETRGAREPSVKSGFGSSTVRAFLRRSDSLLADQAALTVITAAPVEAEGAEVIAAARVLLDGSTPPQGLEHRCQDL